MSATSFISNLRDVAADGSGMWLPAMRVGDLDQIQSNLGPVLLTLTVVEVNQHIEHVSLALYFFK